MIGEKKSPELSEEKFIQNGSLRPTFGLAIWLSFLLLTMALIFIGLRWYSQNDEKKLKKNPFAQVTNRDFSIFLWQFPSYIRSNVKQKNGYLTGFAIDRVNFEIATAEEFIVAPPDLIFLYHNWKRLLSKDVVPAEIHAAEFIQFLLEMPEWDPKNWKKAPLSYGAWLDSKEAFNEENLARLSEKELPLIVRQAFLGWKSYFKEGPQINSLEPSIEQIILFLEQYPNYNHNFWRNISEVAGQKVAGKDYLHFEENLSSKPLPGFFKFAFFNYFRAN